MARFVDTYFPENIAGYEGEVSTIWNTQIVEVDSGSEQANSRWADPKREISLPQGVRDDATLQQLYKFWLGARGPFRTWPFRDWLDFATVDLPCDEVDPVVSATDQVFGVGDGVTRTFQLAKTYTFGDFEDYVRDIHFPVVAEMLVAVAGVPTTAYSVSRPGGIVTFDVAPGNGLSLTWGGLFDLQCRFEDDSVFSAVAKAFRLNGFSSIPLKEVPYCAD